jgi:hypothetical protein
MLQRMVWLITVVFILCVSPAVGEQAPAGNWQSVDFVRNVEDFTPGKKSFSGTLFLKEFQCSATGTASMGWSCKDGWTTSNGTKIINPKKFIAKLKTILKRNS